MPVCFVVEEMILLFSIKILLKKGLKKYQKRVKRIGKTYDKHSIGKEEMSFDINNKEKEGFGYEN